MRKKLILVVITLFLLITGYSTAYASEEEVVTEEVITLEKAISLAKANSRNLAKHELNRDIAKSKKDQAENQRNNDWNSYNNLGNRYDNLLQQYYNAIENGSDVSGIEKEIQDLEKSMSTQYEKLNSAISMRSAENTLKDSEKQVEKYLKQLEYEVEQHYIKILNQEEALETTKKELELKQSLMKAESAKLQLGNSTRTKVDQLSTEITNINKKIIETTNLLNVNRLKFNDIMGRTLNDKIVLEHFNVPEKVDLPEYDTLLSKVNQEYDGLYKLKRDIDDSEDDLDSKTDYYERRVLSLEIKSKEL